MLMVAYSSVGNARGRVTGLGLLVLLTCACGSSTKHGDDDSAGAQAGDTGSGGASANSGGAGGGANGGKGGGSSGAGARGGSDGDTSTGGATNDGGDANSGGTGGTTGGSGGTGGTGESGGSVGLGGTTGTSGSSGAPNLPPPPTTDFLPLRQAFFDKLDLLFMIDNSPSMQGKQALLAESVPALVQHLMNPDCLDEHGEKTGAVADAATGICPSGVPAFRPVQDLHVGIITSSLGDHGSDDVCSDAENTAEGEGRFYADLAQLLPSVRPTANLYSWNDSGFLVWDPRAQSQVSDPHTPVTANETDPTKFDANFGRQITASGDLGCGYEASLEAWYRFLVDPSPVASVGNNQQTSVRGPTNSVVLAQRQRFLRADSVLGIAMLTDENDCSIMDEDGTQGWLVGFKGGVNSSAFWHMPYATSVCATAPNDPCCRPCASAPRSGCATNADDPVCNTLTNRTTADDSMNLRCFRQKQRFGIDLLYPTSRYVDALRSGTISPRLVDSVPNPLFQGKRTRDEVVFLAMVGVPWQDISTEDSWSGRDLTYMTPQELADNDRWSVILGNVSANVMPTDTLMVESIDPRTESFAQNHPLIKDATIAPATATSNTNPINGHEQAATTSRDDLQFACIFPLEQPISPADCAADPIGCDCNADEFPKNSPLCTGLTNSADGTQVNGKAYPGLRELEVVKGAGAGGVLASICAKNTTAMGTAATDAGFGYNPAMTAFAARLGAAFSPLCLPLPLTVSGSDPTHLACHVAEIEADTAPGDSCDCASRGLSNANAAVTQRAYDDLQQRHFCGDAVQVACSSYCVCEVPELDGDALTSCLNDVDSSATDDGFCYVDPAQGAGDALLVEGCPGGRQRYVRFSGSVPSAGSTPFVDCAPDDQ